MAEFTVEEIIANLNGMPRAVPALDEILSVLHDNLPPVLAALSLPAVKTWDYAGVELDPARMPAILVSAAISTEEFTNRFADESRVAVVAAYPKPMTRRDFQRSFDIAQAVRGVLTMPSVMGMRRNAQGVMVWNWLHPAGFSVVPANWPHFGGWQADFRMTQTPAQTNMWTQG